MLKSSLESLQILRFYLTPDLFDKGRIESCMKNRDIKRLWDGS